MEVASDLWRQQVICRGGKVNCGGGMGYVEVASDLWRWNGICGGDK